MATIDAVLAFWLDELGTEGWYKADDAVDAKISARFGALWEEAHAGGLADWLETPKGALAYLIVTDQFSRNMFRGDARSFATDARARDAARHAIAKGFDLLVEDPERMFFYMPFEHSEHIADQDWSVALMGARLPVSGNEMDRHARAHREVIRQFGRFPYRNEALGRQSTPQELAFIADGGYASALRAVSE
jgi:uncharacterized protein (DUF924 family)